MNITQSGSTLTIRIKTVGISRIDIYIDARPVGSQSIGDGTHTLTAELTVAAGVLKLEGYKNGQYVAARKLNL